MIVPIPFFFRLKMIVQVSSKLESHIFSHQTFYIKKSFDTATSGGVFLVFVIFYCESHTYK